MDRQVTEALASLFCKEHLDNFKAIKRFLVIIGLASHRTHLNAIQKLISENLWPQLALRQYPRAANILRAQFGYAVAYQLGGD